MAPPKRSAQEASIFDDANPIAKQKLAAQAQLAGRGRRGNGNGNGTTTITTTSYPQVNNGHSSLKDLANVSEAVRADHNGTAATNIEWVHEDRKLLIKYRDAHRIPSATAFRNASAQYILATGIGARSPTLAREKSKRRSTKDDLAAAIRKHFKDTAIVENDCLVEVMYRVKTKDKAFRLKFPPKSSR